MAEAAREDEPDRIAFNPWPGVDGLVFAFNRLLFTNNVPHTASWRGLPMLKYPTDLWAYKEIIESTRPNVIVETGTFCGASAIYFADMMALHDLAPDVITVDVIRRGAAKDPLNDYVHDWSKDRPPYAGVTYIEGSSTDPAVVKRVEKMVGGRRAMVVFDSDHSEEHVFDELLAYERLVQRGQYLVVEDVGWVGLNPPPRVALERFLELNHRFEPDHAPDRWFLTQQAGGFLRAVR